MIRKYNASDSPERQNYNGILIFARYEDSNNLYYGGLRVDGNAVIKKKRHGTYTTLFEVPLVSPGAYDRNTNPNVLPLDTWIPLRLSAITEDGGVKLMLYSRNGPEWVLIAEAFDPSAHQPIYSGSGGIRTDFMDAEIGGFRIEAR